MSEISPDSDGIYDEIKRSTSRLLELGCDSVQIMGCWVDWKDKESHRIFYGDGNWYARVGMAKAFLDGDDAETMADRIAEKMEHPGDE